MKWNRERKELNEKLKAIDFESMREDMLTIGKVVLGIEVRGKDKKE